MSPSGWDIFLKSIQFGFTTWSGRTSSFPTSPMVAHSLRSSRETYATLGSYARFSTNSLLTIFSYPSGVLAVGAHLIRSFSFETFAM